jgi:hypothetical protein
MDAKDILSLSLGGVGTVLGIWNALRTHSKEKVKLKVIPKIYGHTADGARTTINDDVLDVFDDFWEGVCIEVVNVASVAAWVVGNSSKVE